MMIQLVVFLGLFILQDASSVPVADTHQQQRRTLFFKDSSSSAPEDLLQVTGSVVLSIVVLQKPNAAQNASIMNNNFLNSNAFDNDNITDFASYQPQLVWAVDILTMETVSFLNRDWGRRRMEEEESRNRQQQRRLDVRADLPTTVKPFASSTITSSQTCLDLVQHFDPDYSGEEYKCEQVQASVQLYLTSGEEDPLYVEESFEAIFEAATQLGRLQSILDESFPESALQIWIVTNKTLAAVQQMENKPTSPPTSSPPIMEEEEEDDNTHSPLQDPQDYFDDTATAAPVVSVSSSSSNPNSRLLIGAILGIVAGAFAAFCLVGGGMVSCWHLSMRRRRKKLYAATYDEEGRDGLMGNHSSQDLAESYSLAGLEWGKNDSNDLEAAPDDPVAKNLNENYFFKDEPSPDYQLPATLAIRQSSPRSKNKAIAEAGTPTSSNVDVWSTTSSSVDTNSTTSTALAVIGGGTSTPSHGIRLVDFTGKVRVSPRGVDEIIGEEEHKQHVFHDEEDATEQEYHVSLDDLERAIVEGDWETLAAAATTMAAVVTTIKREDDNTTATPDNHTSIAATAATSSSAPVVLVSENNKNQWSHRDKTWQTMMDATKAAELDRLIEDGDWKGIVQAAERYQLETQ